MEWFYVTWERHNPLVDDKAKNWKLFLKSKMYNFLFPFLFSSSSLVISLSLLVFLHLLASSFSVADKASPSSSSASLSLFFSPAHFRPLGPRPCILADPSEVHTVDSATCKGERWAGSSARPGHLAWERPPVARLPCSPST